MFAKHNKQGLSIVERWRLYVDLYMYVALESFGRYQRARLLDKHLLGMLLHEIYCVLSKRHFFGSTLCEQGL